MPDTHLRYNRLVNSNIIGVAVATEAGVLDANDEMLRLAGVTRAEFAERGVDWQAITPPEYLDLDRDGIREILDRGACSPFEKEFVRPDGTRVPMLVGGALLEREPPKWIAFALDLTDRRRAELERDRLLEETRAAREMAEAALRARDVLLAKVTHDLRTPLAAASGYARMMREGIPEPLPDSHHESVRRILVNQEHLLGLLDRLLDFARTTSGRAAFHIETLDVDSVLGEIEMSVAPQSKSASVVYEYLKCEQPLAIRADRVRVTQILVNLIGNAIKFTAAGGRVTLGAAADDEFVRIAVKDTGTGIPASQLTSIFEPFVQGQLQPGDAAPEARSQGLGLGLAISRELARGMGGDIAVESVVGVGSTFVLLLPRAGVEDGKTR